MGVSAGNRRHYPEKARKGGGERLIEDNSPYPVRGIPGVGEWDVGLENGFLLATERTEGIRYAFPLWFL
mgnify:FL=1